MGYQAAPKGSLGRPVDCTSSDPILKAQQRCLITTTKYIEHVNSIPCTHTLIFLSITCVGVAIMNRRIVYACTYTGAC